MTVATTFPALDRALGYLDSRVRAAVNAHYEGLWRFLRRMGVAEDQVEDAAQQVLIVFAQRAADVKEEAVKAFLFGTALRVASDFRRRSQRAREVLDREALLVHPDPRPDAEHQLGEKELRRCLDRLLEDLDPDLRAVFVLAELDEVTMAEISKLLCIPAGTVASRLRRAREIVEARASEMREHLREGRRL
jgi:RNA polymerase sigma-70 factor (ECF subfamily)